MPLVRNGSVVQSAHDHQPDDYAHERIASHMLGIVIDVFMADSVLNRSAAAQSAVRGNRCEARVLILNDGTDNPWIVPNAVVLPPGSSGTDNYSEEIPKGCSQMVDGSAYGVDVDPALLDGDYCLVGFVGGNIKQPYIIKWWPHPSNVLDNATAGLDNNLLKQGRRFFKRFQGAKITITKDGSIYVDTSESGFQVVGAREGLKRLSKEPGGALKVTIKQNQEFELNFNPPVDDPLVPSIPQSNPPKAATGSVRQDTLSRLTMDKDLVELIAGQVVQVLTRQGNIQVIAQQVAQIIGTSGGVELGAMSLTSEEGTLNGQAFDPLTKLKHHQLGNASTIVRNKK